MDLDRYEIILKAPKGKYNFKLKEKILSVIDEELKNKDDAFKEEFWDLWDAYGCNWYQFKDTKDKTIKKLDSELVHKICKYLDITFLNLVKETGIEDKYIHHIKIDIDLSRPEYTTDEFKKSFAKRFKDRMQAIGIPDSKTLAQRTGLAESFISDLINCKKGQVKADDFEEICKRLFCTQDYLLLKVNSPSLYQNYREGKKIPYGTQIFIYGLESERSYFINYVKFFMNIKHVTEEQMRTALNITTDEYKKYFDPEYGKIVIPAEHITIIAGLLGMTVKELESGCGYVFPERDPSHELKPVITKLDESIKVWLNTQKKRGNLTEETQVYIKRLVQILNSNEPEKEIIKKLLS